MGEHQDHNPLNRKLRPKSLLHSAQDGLAKQYHQLATDRLCIGITGLSGSGKSTFITSFINQLKQHKSARLSAFSPWLKGKILAVVEHPLEDRRVARFDYAGALKGLVGEDPVWPQSTRDISGVLLEIKLRDQGLFGRRTSRSLFIELRDYPGEWLLDLPMLKQSYLDWSCQCEALLGAEPRASIAENPYARLMQLSPASRLSDTELGKLSDQYRRFLQACKAQPVPLSLIQPGRLLLPGHSQIPEPLFPMLSLKSASKAALQKLPRDSVYKVLERHFEAYKRDQIKPFYKAFIAPIDRQIILVDVLAALNAGPAYLEDLKRSLEAISQCFHYGRNSVFRSRIEKVVFAATKVDQVITREHDNVRQLLGAVVKAALERATYQDAEYKSEAIASLRAAQDIQIDTQECMSGRTLNGEAIGYTHPEIPCHLPTAAEWAPFADWQLPKLKPPSGVRADQDQALPHIRLDQIMQDLLGDRCR